MKIGPLNIGPLKIDPLKIALTQILLVAFAAALMTANAEAQGMGGSGGRNHRAKTAKAQSQVPKADDKAYKAALKGIPDKQFDPWHAVR